MSFLDTINLNGTNYEIGSMVGEVLSENRPIYFQWESGGMYEGTGIPYYHRERSRSLFTKVEPGETLTFYKADGYTADPMILEFADNTPTASGVNTRLKASYARQDEVTLTMTANTHYIRVQMGTIPIEEAGKQCWFVRNVKYVGKKPTEANYPTVASMIADTALVAGQIVRTSGFNANHDFGGGKYQILATGSGWVDNCSVFALTNGLYAHRIFDEPFVYLESLNFPTVSMDVINEALQMHDIHDVRCGVIETSQSISIKDYDLTFDTINYTGTDFAIILDTVTGRRVTGSAVNAPNGSCIKLTCHGDSCRRNYIQISTLYGKDIGLGIFPENGYGVSANYYNIRDIKTSLYGIRCYIPANTGYYSWEGEELFSISNSTATNEDGTGIGVSIEVGAVDNICVDGTITGLTFLNLAVEDSDTGIDIQCGTTLNPQNYDAGIKSLYFNNLRGRETWKHTMWLTGRGYIRNLYIQTTAPTRFFQWDLQTTAGYGSCVVDGPLCLATQTMAVAKGLVFRSMRKIVSPITDGVMNITQDTDYAYFDEWNDQVDIESYYGDVIFANKFMIDESLRGQTVKLNLEHYMDDSANGLLFVLPGATQADGAVTLEVTYYYPRKKITLTNTSPDTHVYQITVLSRFWYSNTRFIVNDLGVPDEDVTVANSYVEPTTT